MDLPAASAIDDELASNVTGKMRVETMMKRNADLTRKRQLHVEFRVESVGAAETDVGRW